MPTSPADAAGQDRPAVMLSLKDVVSGYGGAPIVRGVSAQVGSGEIVTIVGPKALNARVGQPLTLTAVVTDDGVPAVRPRQARANQPGCSGSGPARSCSAAPISRTSAPAAWRGLASAMCLKATTYSTRLPCGRTWRSAVTVCRGRNSVPG